MSAWAEIRGLIRARDERALADRVLALDFLFVVVLLTMLVLAIRYESSMYFEAALLMALVWNPAIRARRGFVSGAFLAGYGVARLVGEFFRQPDAHLGFLFVGATMGQLLSVPMILAGAWLMLRAKASEAQPSAAMTDGAPDRHAG